jgi:hypothetical protein
MDPKHKEERRAFNEALRARMRLVAARPALRVIQGGLR